MEVSVVVPTLNDREQLADCLDALRERAPSAEVIVVNGPSADGTTGMIKDRSDVDVLIEIADRNRNIARNAGCELATGDVVAFLAPNRIVESSWLTAIEKHTHEAAGIVTGPTRGTLSHIDRPASGGPSGIDWDPGNFAVRRNVFEELGGFDEQLEIGGVADMLTRAESEEVPIDWAPSMGVSVPYGTDGGIEEIDRYRRYRSFTYQKLKQRGLHPLAIAAIGIEALRDAVVAAAGIVRGDVEPSGWFASGKHVLRGLASGCKRGLTARYRSDTTDSQEQPIADTIVHEYDWRTNR